MFRYPSPENTPRARAPSGKIVPIAIPFKGMNAQSSFSVMGPEYALNLNNVIAESYGLRTRKGYTEWTDTIGDGTVIGTILNYLPAVAVGSLAGTQPEYPPLLTKVLTPAGPSTLAGLYGQLFAAQGGFIYDVTSGGAGPFTPEVGVTGTGPYWNGLNFQNVAGSFLCICNENGGYAIYDGSAWTMPAQGTNPGEIEGVNPANLNFVASFKQRLWFVEKGTTRAWYLPVEQITGKATMFDFGSQFNHGGELAVLASWTVDGGDGMDDHLVAISSQGDVVIYKGTDPDNADTFQIHGTWYCGPLPSKSKRAVLSAGGEVHILSQLGISPVSKLLTATSLSADMEQHVSYIIDPIIARLMRDYSELQGWQLLDCAKEELMCAAIPIQAGAQYGGTFLAYKVTNQTWQVLSGTGWSHLLNIGPAVYGGTYDGRVVRAFNGPLDNVKLGTSTGDGIRCQVIPAYQALGQPGHVKRIPLIRPTFLTSVSPALSVTILTDYGGPRPASVPTLPQFYGDKWDVGIWDTAKWSGLKQPIKYWLGCKGYGFAATPQLDFIAGGDTLLMAIDFWTEDGGVM